LIEDETIVGRCQRQTSPSSGSTISPARSKPQRRSTVHDAFSVGSVWAMTRATCGDARS
jgi:hypothetical protein